MPAHRPKGRLWLDIETRSRVSVVDHGVHRHAADPETEILCAMWAVDDGPIRRWSASETAARITGAAADFSGLHDLFEAMSKADEVWAHNAAYERLVLDGWARRRGLPPPMPLERTRCSQAAAAAFNLPQSLDKLSKALLPADGRKLETSARFKRIWSTDHEPGPSDLDGWSAMLEYCVRDVEAMREAMSLLPALPDGWWAEYAVSERINDRGVGVDLALAAAAVRYRERIDAEVRRSLQELTGGAVTTPRGPQARLWVEARLREHAPHLLHEERGTLARARKKRREDVIGFTSEVRDTFDRDTRSRLAAELEGSGVPALDDVLRLIELVDEASQSAATKYAACLAMADPESWLLKGMYRYNGAAQTGRFSSTGMQLHNLLREVPKDVEGLCERILAFDEGVTMRDLGRMLRPTLVAPEGGALCWADWSAIEARALPWLSGSQRAQPLLDLFADGGDVYVHEAAHIYGVDEAALSAAVADGDPDAKEKRQIGKVAVLSLGFGGGSGAFLAMGRNYGVRVDADRAQRIVAAWREANPWATLFWERLMAAAVAAVEQPGTPQAAGRVTYWHEKGLLGGTLLVFLPSGRFLAYPNCKMRRIERFEGQEEWGLAFRHPTYGLSALWHGGCAENVTQGTAACLLRSALTRWEAADANGSPVVAHTHDEIVVETDIERARETAEDLARLMSVPPDWAEGLPLSAEAAWGERYKVPLHAT